MYASNFVQVGANIQRELDKNGFTQQSLADALGISKQVMNKIVRGSKAINVNEISRIAEVLGTTAEKLLTAEVEQTSEETLSFMGKVTDEETMKKVDLLRNAIDEIHMLEDLLHG